MARGSSGVAAIAQWLGIGTFSDRARDFLRGGGPFDGGDSLVKNQGFVNGLFYDDNGSGGGKTRGDLMHAGDIVKVGLAGSIRGYRLQTSDDQIRTLEQIDYNGQPAGYVSDPQEVVNYFENHDNQTLFDNNVYKLPLATSGEDACAARCSPRRSTRSARAWRTSTPASRPCAASR